MYSSISAHRYYPPYLGGFLMVQPFIPKNRGLLCHGFLLLLKELDKVKLGFESGDEGLFFFDLILGLFD